MTQSEFKKKITRINQHFNKIEDLLNSLPEGLQEEVREFHNEEATLQHCTRWGLQGSEEILEDSKSVYKRADENYNL